MAEPKDFIAAQGARAFGTRLRRLFETLNRGVSEIYADAGVAFEPRWFGLITLLRARERIDIGSAAAALGQSHVAVVQVANVLERRGLVRRVRSKTDGRSRDLQITAKGKALCTELDPLWDRIAAATQSLLKEAAPNFLNELDGLDEALARRTLFERCKSRSR